MANANTPHPKLWTKRKRLQCSGFCPGIPCTLPLFVHNDDVDNVFVTDVDDRPMPCCRDSVYEALDHVLFWLGCTPSNEGHIVAHVYVGMAGGCGGPRLFRPADVLALAEYFQGGRAGVLSRWEACTKTGTALGRSQVSVEPFLAIEEGGVGTPRSESIGDTLWMQPSEDGVVLRHKVFAPFKDARSCRVHLRAHFYDDGESASCHWLGYGSVAGEAAVGLLSCADRGNEFYGYIHGVDILAATPSFQSPWQRTFVPRSAGWHMFELVWEDQMLHVLIDNEPICAEPASGCRKEEEVMLYSDGLGYSVWAGVELFHTPRGQSTWASGCQSVKPGDFSPWQLNQTSTERGFWQDSGAYVIEHVSTGRICTLVPTWVELVAAFEAIWWVSGYSVHTMMRDMLGRAHEIVDERNGMFGLLCPDGHLRYFPPAVCLAPHEEEKQESVEAKFQEKPQTLEEPPPQLPEVMPANATILPPPQPQIAFECWSIPKETDIDQIERVVAHFVELLQGEGVALPGNIRLVAPCREASHRRCFVYRFGTRRLHFATRSLDDGRLLLVVRCGGGFMDFLDFARRHGALERSRMQRCVGANATGTVRLNRVLVDGKAQFQSSRLAGA